MQEIKKLIHESIEVKQSILNDDDLISTVAEVAKRIEKAFKKGKKVLFCGNGGSAADAQHLAAEFSGKYLMDREPLFAEALHCNTSYMTAVANDYSYNEIYSRLVKGKGEKGDILFAISTSGNSGNIIEAINTAKNKGLIVIGLTGSSGGKMKDICDYIIKVPSDETPRIQESHVLIGHIICGIVEKSLFA